MSIVQRLLYEPAVNRLARTALRPVGTWLPESAKFPVTGRVRVELPGDRSIVLESNPTCFAAKRLFWHGYRGFEGDQFDLFTTLVADSTTFLDIGANVGYYSLLASLYRPGIEVHAFEPLPAAFEYFGRNVKANGFDNVRRHRLALSDATGTTTFHAARNPKFDWVEHHLTATGSINADQAGRTFPATSFLVDVARLDDFVAEHGITGIDLIKIDTEATEHRVLASGMDTIDRFRPIIFCEVLPGAVEDEIEARVRDLGYRAFRVARGRLEVVEHLAHTVETTNDYLFCHPTRLDRLTTFRLTGD